MGINSNFFLKTQGDLQEVVGQLNGVRNAAVAAAKGKPVKVGNVKVLQPRDLAGSILYPDEFTGLAIKLARFDHTLKSLPEKTVGFALTLTSSREPVDIFVGVSKDKDGNWSYSDYPSLWGPLTEVLEAAVKAAPTCGLEAEYSVG